MDKFEQRRRMDTMRFPGMCEVSRRVGYGFFWLPTHERTHFRFANSAAETEYIEWCGATPRSGPRKDTPARMLAEYVASQELDEETEARWFYEGIVPVVTVTEETILGMRRAAEEAWVNRKAK